MMHVESHLFSLSELKTAEPAALPPVVISPTEVDHVTVTLEKNQQCACKDCGKLFNSVWYLKQHAVKHSNDRPFRCKFCLKTYKFRSNLYQHKCPDRVKNGNARQRLISRTLIQSQHSHTAVLSNGNHTQIASLQTAVNISDEFHEHKFHMPGYGPNISLIQLGDTGYPASTANGIASEMSAEKEKRAEKNENETQQGSSTRKKPLDQTIIDEYIQRNKHKLFQCRKCRVQFPSREYLSRHTAYHTEVELLAYKCIQCPQRFSAGHSLKKHVELHSLESNFKCRQCTAHFRSMLALRRHKHGCRQCLSPPFGVPVNHIMDTASCALDEFAFIDADEAATMHSPLTVMDEDAIGTKGTDSGLGSEGSNQSCTTSPARSSVHLEEYDGFDSETKRNFPPIAKIRIVLNGEVIHAEKKDQEEDDEFGCRSRLNSGAHSGSQTSISAISSDRGSPTRKASLPAAVADGAGSVYTHYNSFVPSGHGQHVTASRSYVNGGVAGRAANFSVGIFEAADDFDCNESTSDTVALLRRSIFRPRLLKPAVSSSASNSFVESSLQALHNDVYLHRAVETAKSEILRSTASCLMLMAMFEVCCSMKQLFVDGTVARNPLKASSLLAVLVPGCARSASNVASAQPKENSDEHYETMHHKDH